MKLTAKQLYNLTAARADFSVNDGYLKQKYGVTGEQVAAFISVVDGIAGMSWRDLKLTEINAALAGKRVWLSGADDAQVRRLEQAFAKKA